MSKREVVVMGLLAVGIACAFGGIALITRDVTHGWIGIIAAIPMLLIAQRSMRVARADD